MCWSSELEPLACQRLLVLLQSLQQHSLVLLLACLQLELLLNPLPKPAAGQSFKYSMKQMIKTLAKPGKGTNRNSTTSQYAPVGQHLQHWLHNSGA